MKVIIQYAIIKTLSNKLITLHPQIYNLICRRIVERINHASIWNLSLPQQFGWLEKLINKSSITNLAGSRQEGWQNGLMTKLCTKREALQLKDYYWEFLEPKQAKSSAMRVIFQPRFLIRIQQNHHTQEEITAPILRHNHFVNNTLISPSNALIIKLHQNLKFHIFY